MKVSLVIPACNEEGTISEIIKGARQHVDEIIVAVAKKSNDNTFKIASGLADQCFIDDGRGKGQALKLGIEKTQFDVVLFMDSDGSHDPNDIPKILQPIMNGNNDLVVGSRALGGSDELHSTFSEFIRNVGGAIIMLCINYFYNVRFTDCENGFRAIKKDVFKALRLRSVDFDIEQEMFIKAIRHRYSVMEVPTHEYRRRFGNSNLNVLKKGWKFVWRLFISFID